MEPNATDPFATLRGARYMVLTTYRRSGEAVPTTLWFAQQGDRLYAYTGATSGKVKRIRNNPHVRVAPGTVSGTPRGPAVPAFARILPEHEARIADAEIERKYGAQRRLLRLVRRLARSFGAGSGTPGESVYLEITADRAGI